MAAVSVRRNYFLLPCAVKYGVIRSVYGDQLALHGVYMLTTPLEFQEGDILRVYQPDHMDSALVVYYQKLEGVLKRSAFSRRFNL